MKVFIEQPGETLKKNIFNKETGAYEQTVDFHITYPYAYGYITNTLAPDGDELDCYIITDKKLESCSVVDCEPIGMVEYFENDQPDHKILAVLKGENFTVSEEVKTKLLEFNAQYYEGNTERKTRVGDFLRKKSAEAEIEKSSFKG